MFPPRKTFHFLQTKSGALWALPFTGLPHMGARTFAARLSCEGRVCGCVCTDRMGLVCPAGARLCGKILPEDDKD